MSEQVRYILTNQVNNKRVIVRGFITNRGLNRTTIGTIEKNDDFQAGAGDFFGLSTGEFKIGEEVSEVDLSTYADDNGYDLQRNTSLTEDSLFEEIAAPSVLTAIKNGGSPTDTIDLAWTDNSSGVEQESGFKIERREATQEITTITSPTGAAAVQGDHAIVETNAGVDYLYWFDIDAAGTEPTSARFVFLKAKGRTIEVDIVNGDTAVQVADKIFAAINATFSGAGMTVTDPAGGTADIVINQDVYGETQAAIEFEASGTSSGSLVVVITADGTDTSFVEITTVAQDVVVFQDTGLTTNVQHFYRVRGFDANGDSAFSNIDSDTTD